ncbi:MAG: energy transducer TonB [Pyrinomonadaceae bacterium]
MGKIVKFCSSCDEGFAEKFGFCPNCGQTLTAFEMSPVGAETSPSLLAEEPSTQAPLADEPTAAIFESAPLAEPVEKITTPDVTDENIEIDEPAFEAPAVPAPTYSFAETKDADSLRTSVEPRRSSRADDGGFYVTVIEEKNGGKRNALMAGTLGLMLIGLMTALVINIFTKDLEVGSINDDIFSAMLVEVEPTQVEEEVKKAKDEGGGGGGGGRKEQEELTKGDLADQTPDPIRPPDAKIPRLDNPSLVLPPPSTEGNRKFEKVNDRWGDPNGRFTSFSNGTGSGGGQGSGVGTGQGSGRGTGAGSGDGSGSGSGIGSGNGAGRGAGGGADGEAPPPPRPVGVTQALKINSKPKPTYTDAARQNSIQGLVILRVTFLASGQIGSISPIKGLPHGLTEQAIAAARRISFEPMKRDGVGQAVTKQVEYNFAIY